MPRRPALSTFYRSLLATGAVLALLGVSLSAQARVETLRWEHPNPEVVDGFRVYVGSRSGDYARSVDAGMPIPGSDGIFEYGLTVEDGSTVYVAVAAYQDGGAESALSNERIREAFDSGGSDDSGGTGGSDGDDDSGSTGGSDGSGDSGGSWSLDSDAALSQDFEGHALGTAVSGWVDTGSGNSLVEEDGLFSVGELGNNRVLSTSSTATDIHSHYVGGISDEWSAYEISGRMRGSASHSRLGVTAYSGYDGADAYYRIGTHWQTAELEIYRHPSPDGSFSCASAGTGATLQEDQWYRFRLQVEPIAEGTRVRAKAWAQGEPEPSGWPARCLDSRANAPASGTVGVWSGNGGTKYWDDLRINPVDEADSLTSPGRPVLVHR